MSIWISFLSVEMLEIYTTFSPLKEIGNIKIKHFGDKNKIDNVIIY